MKISKKVAVLGALVFVVILAGAFYVLFNRAAKAERWMEKMFCRTSPTWDYPPLPPERTISFPENIEVGLLYTITGKGNYNSYTAWKLYGPATGKIKLQDGTSVCLEIRKDFSSILSALEPNSIQAIDFSAPFDLPFELYTDNQTKRIVELSDEDLEAIKHLEGLYQLVLHNTTITDKSLSCISQIKSLRSINLFNTKITDVGLFNIAQLPFLEEVYLGATDISDEGLKQLSKLSYL